MVLVTDASVGRVLGGAQIVPEKNRESFLLSKNVCWCWLRMLLLAEYVPATMLDPKALGTALEFHILTFIEQCSGTQGRRRCLAAGFLDIWRGTDPPDLGTAWHGTSLVYRSQFYCIHHQCRTPTQSASNHRPPRHSSALSTCCILACW